MLLFYLVIQSANSIEPCFLAASSAALRKDGFTVFVWRLILVNYQLAGFTVIETTTLPYPAHYRLDVVAHRLPYRTSPRLNVPYPPVPDVAPVGAFP